MIDYFLFGAVIWAGIGFGVAAYLIGNRYYLSRDGVKISLAWPYYLFETPSLIRERRRNDQARASRLE